MVRFTAPDYMCTDARADLRLSGCIQEPFTSCTFARRSGTIPTDFTPVVSVLFVTNLLQLIVTAVSARV